MYSVILTRYRQQDCKAIKRDSRDWTEISENKENSYGIMR